MIKKLVGKVKEIIRKYHLYAFKDVVIFMAILIIFHFLWKIFVKDMLALGFIRDSANWLAEFVYVQTRWILDGATSNVTAFDEMTINGRNHKNVFFHAPNIGYVYVNQSCSGLKQFYQWFFLMILYPGPWRHKLWFIPLGLVTIHFVNILRVLGMVAVTIHLPEHWDFMHDYIMRPFFYVVMFGLWVWWNEKFYLPMQKAKSLNG